MSNNEIKEGLAAALVDPEVPVQYSPVLMAAMKALSLHDAPVECKQEAVAAERDRCAAIVQLAREDEIDRDWRSIIHRIESGWSPSLIAEKSTIKSE